ncbi:type IV pilus secretin PilQ [Desulfonatronovibrio magnus]|uniref:type IV pilus secretin PilQ n=1 Tax=Desulfonatronovibrio magnus TaxID=698827 RepID=UPI0006982D39|nr:type IV pilus secretin PilQ [Desulfonatronovibrio magnus]
MHKNIVFFIIIFFQTLALCCYADNASLADQERAADMDGPDRIELIDFWQDEMGATYISIAGPDIPLPEMEEISPQRTRAIIPGFQARPSQARLYRLDDFESGLKSLLVQNIDQNLVLTWTWYNKKSFDLVGSQNSIIFRVDPASAPLDDPALTSSPQVSTAQLATDQPGTQQDFLEFNTLFPGMKQEYTGDLISIDMQNAEVEHVIRLITSITDYNLILDENVTGRISLRLINVPWDQALDLVLVQKNLGMVLRGDIIRIATAQKLEAERDQARRAREAEARARESMRQLEPLQQEFIQINYSQAGELLPQIRDFLSERGKVTHDSRTNTLILQDTSAHIRQITALINRLDRPERQVHIEARIVYASEDFSRSMGIQWSFLYPEQNSFTSGSDMVTSVNYQSMNFPRSPGDFGALGGTLDRRWGSTMFTLDAELRLGEAQNKSRTVSAPRITTLNNQEARIEQGFQIPYTTQTTDGPDTQFEEATLSLLVTPQITSDNDILLTIEVRDDYPVEAFGATAIETRSVRSRLLVENGETIVIGGIKKTSEDEVENRIPALGNIPFLGWLFKNQYVSESKNELLIFIRPEII